MSGAAVVINTSPAGKRLCVSDGVERGSRHNRDLIAGHYEAGLLRVVAY
jgi:hypothetical protein